MTNKDYKPLTTGGYANPKMLQEYRDRLCYLEDCIKNGTLVFLPCKVGDKLTIDEHEKQAVKEFAEKMKKQIANTMYCRDGYVDYDDTMDVIDELLKEFFEQ